MRALARRLGASVATLAGITLLTFAGVRQFPGDAVSGLSGPESPALPPETRARLRERYGLDRPWPVEYTAWAGRVVRLDFGASLRDGRPVRQLLAERLPVTLGLVTLSFLAAFLIAVPLGAACAARAGSLLDRGTAAVLLAAGSVPSYWLAALGVVFLGGGGYLDWFPVIGLESPGASSGPVFRRVADRAWHLVLPVSCLTVGAVAAVSRVARAAVIEALSRDFVLAAQARGLAPGRLLWGHAVRASLVPLISIASTLFPALLGGAVIVESVFAIPGLGLLGLDALAGRDLPVIAGVVTVSALLTMAVMLAADLAYRWVDPRVSDEAWTA